MGWFSAIKRAIFGSPQIMTDIFDKKDGHLAKLGGWIGNMKFTAEEQAEMNRGLSKAIRQHAVDTMSESTVRSKARRDIAIMVIRAFLIQIFLTIATYPIDPEWSKMIFSVASSWVMGGLVSGVAAFFFGTHLQRSMKKES